VIGVTRNRPFSPVEGEVRKTRGFRGYSRICSCSLGGPPV